MKVAVNIDYTIPAVFAWLLHLSQNVKSQIIIRNFVESIGNGVQVKNFKVYLICANCVAPHTHYIAIFKGR